MQGQFDWGLALGAIGVIGIPVAVGLTMAATTTGEFRFVRGCFIAAAILTLGSFVWLTHEHQLSVIKIILAGVIGALVSIGLVVALNWVNKKESPSTEQQTNNQTTPKGLAKPKNQPDNFLLTLFMTDFFMKFSGVTANWTKDLELNGALGPHKTTFFYNTHADFQSHAKFVSVYVQSPVYLTEICKYVAENIRQFLEEEEKTMPLGWKSGGESTVDTTKNLPYSGRVYLYYPNILSIEELAEITRLFRENGSAVQIRGPEYATGVWANIESGRTPMPSLYEIKENYPVKVSN